MDSQGNQGYSEYVEYFALHVRELFFQCPAGRDMTTAEHACLKHSGRIGRAAAAKDVNEKAVRLAVIAHVRHVGTRYDKLMARGYDRWDARVQVQEEVDRILSQWEGFD